jgi:hypothetical protein
MNQNQDSNFSSLLFHLLHVDYITDSTYLDFSNGTSLQYTLIVFTNTETGTLSIDDTPYFVAHGKALLLPPGTTVELTNMNNNLCFYKLTFTAIHIEQQMPTYYVEQLFNERVNFIILIPSVSRVLIQ